MSTFVITVTAAWAEVGSQLTEHGFRSGSRADASLGKAIIEVEGPGSTALIEIWEHAQCLDITILYLPALESAILSAGPCPSNAEVHARLLALLTILRKRASVQASAILPDCNFKPSK